MTPSPETYRLQTMAYKKQRYKSTMQIASTTDTSFKSWHLYVIWEDRNVLDTII